MQILKSKFPLALPRIVYFLISFFGSSLTTAGLLYVLGFIVEDYWKISNLLIILISLINGWSSGKSAWRLEVPKSSLAKVIHVFFAFVGSTIIISGIFIVLLIVPVALLSDFDDQTMRIIGRYIGNFSSILALLFAVHAWKWPLYFENNTNVLKSTRGSSPNI